MTHTGARIWQWVGIILVISMMGGAYWYFQVYGSTVNAPQNDSLTSGLVGLWSFNGDDISGTTAYDRSGSGNNGTLTNGPTVTQGKVGQALNFDGTDDYISVVNNANLNGSQGTWVFWIKQTVLSSGNGYGVMGKTDASGSYNGINVFTSGSSAAIQIKGADGTGALGLTAGSIGDLGWHHVAFSFVSGGVVKAYFDGALITSGTAPSFTFSSQSLRFGRSVDSYWENFKGVLDEARIYNRALSATEIQSLYALGQSDKANSAVSQPQGTGRLDSGLAGYWKLDENTGTSAADSSTNGNTGTLTNGPTWTTGQIGSAVTFDGTDDNISIGNLSVYNPSDNFTISAWINLNSTSGLQCIFCKDASGDVNSQFRFVVGEINAGKIGYGDISGTSFGGSTALSTSTWYHVLITRSPSTGYRIYLNGVIDGTSAAGGSPSGNSRSAYIGARVSNAGGLTSYFNGKIDDVRFYNRALPVDEVSQLYRLTTPTGVDTGLKGYWSFNGQDISGTTAYDRSGSGNTGTLTNGPVITNGIVGQALALDVSNDEVTIPDSVSLSPTGAFAISYWINVTGTITGQSHTLVSKSEVSQRTFFMTLTSTGNVVFLVAANSGDSGSNYGVSSGALVRNQWTHVTAVFDGSGTGNTERAKVYINGVPQVMTYTGTIPSSVPNTTSSLRVGGSTSVPPLGGIYDEVRFYNRALSAAEIQSLYALGQSDKVNSSASQPQGTGRLDSGLAGYWKLDENTGTSAADSSTNGNTGTLTNGPTWTTGQIGSAASFDNSNDYITVGDPSNGSLDPNLITVTAWFKLNAVGNGLSDTSYIDELVSKDLDCCSDLGGYSLMSYGYGQSSKIYSLIRRNSNGAQLSAMGATSLTAGTWYHGAMVFDGTKITMYLNGTKDGVSSTISADTVKASSLPLYIGSVSSGGPGYVTNGAIDEVRIYNRALSADEVAQLYRLTTPTGVDTSLKGYWSFNGKDLSGTTAYDRSGSGNNGTLTNGPAIAEGKVGQALSFNGSNQFVSASSSNPGSQETIAAWIKPVALPGARTYFVLQTDGAACKRGVAFETSGKLGVAANGDWLFNDGGPVLPTEAWTHAVVVFNGASGSKLYVNGVEVVSNATVVSAETATTNLYLAGQNIAYGCGASYNQMALDEVRIYNRALSAAEIAALYNASR